MLLPIIKNTYLTLGIVVATICFKPRVWQ